MDRHHDAAAHASPDDEYLETPPGSTYEHTDANVWIIVKFLFWLAISAVVVHFGLGLLYALLIDRAMERGEQQYPLTAGQEERLPPTPRLQQFPRNELYDFRAGEETFLQGYGWMNKEAGTVHIPIEEAMRLTVERGLPSRAPADGLQPETPGMMPSDSSSGRELERRRQ
jgi:hypothetical protein